MADLLNKQFLRLRDALDNVLEMKNNGLNLDAQRSSAALMFVALKHSNRDVKRNIKLGKDDLHLEKSKVDVSRLQLQNLLYEVSHLKREIIRCQKFNSRDSNLELLSVEEYSKDFIVEEESSSCNHKKHLHRLQCELELRKALDKQYNNLMISKQQLLKDNFNQHQKYSSFAPALRSLLDSTKPLHDALQLNLDVEWKLGSIVKYLPKPLYLLFINLQSLQRRQKSFFLNAEIIGLEEDVQAEQIILAKRRASKISIGEAAYPQTNTNDSTSLWDNMEKPYLTPHPLNLSVTIGSLDKSNQLILSIWYWQRLQCVTVRPSNINIFSDFNFVEHLLDYLYPDDLGDKIPIVGIQYELQKLKMTSEQCVEYIVNKQFGKPYCWLQHMCCIPTVNKLKHYQQELNLQTCIGKLFDGIIERLHSWELLIQQIRGLMYKDADLHALKENIYPAGLSCSLVQWTGISKDEFHSQNPGSITIGSEKDEIYAAYRAIFVRGSAKMECFICIPNCYPVNMPVWILNVHWNGCRTSQNNSAIKMMEYWTNSLNPKQLPQGYRFLYAQLFRTIYSFDIFLETEGCLQSNVEYNKVMPYISPFSKRIRLRPYKYIRKGSIYAFKQ